MPAGEGGAIDVRYAPERSYVIVLLGGLVVSLLALLLALALLVFTRLGPERPVDLRPAREVPGRRIGERWLRRAFRLGSPVLSVAALAGAWVLGGVPAAIGLALAGALVRLGWERTLAVLAATLLVAGPALVAVYLQLDRPAPQPAADILTGTGFVLAVASVLPWPARARRAVAR